MEALADTLLVVAKATAGAVTSLGGTVTVENVLAGGTLLLGAVRSAIAQIALASDVLGGIPRSLVGGTGRLGQSLLRHADASVGAFVGTEGTLAGHAVVPLEALALATFTIANALVGALRARVGIVGTDDISGPGVATGACAKAAIVADVGGFSEAVTMALALVIQAFEKEKRKEEDHVSDVRFLAKHIGRRSNQRYLPTASVLGAIVGTYSCSDGKQGEEEGAEELHLDARVQGAMGMYLCISCCEKKLSRSCQLQDCRPSIKKVSSHPRTSRKIIF